MMLREDDGEIKGFEVQMAQRRHRPPPYKGIISPSEVLSIGKIIQRIWRFKHGYCSDLSSQERAETNMQPVGNFSSFYFRSEPIALFMLYQSQNSDGVYSINFVPFDVAYVSLQARSKIRMKEL